MNLINTNRLRVSVMRTPQVFRLPNWGYGSYWSADHDKPRKEWNCYVLMAGFWASLKFRPDGR